MTNACTNHSWTIFVEADSLSCINCGTDMEVKPLSPEELIQAVYMSVQNTYDVICLKAENSISEDMYPFFPMDSRLKSLSLLAPDYLPLLEELKELIQDFESQLKASKGLNPHIVNTLTLDGCVEDSYEGFDLAPYDEAFKNALLKFATGVLAESSYSPDEVSTWLALKTPALRFLPRSQRSDSLFGQE